MIDELIAVVNVNEPVEITPVQVPAEPTKVESQAHKDWAAAKKAFMDNYTIYKRSRTKCRHESHHDCEHW